MRRTWSLSDRSFDGIVYAALFLVALVIAYPLYFVIIASISEPFEVAKGNVFFYPKGITLEAYHNVFSNNLVWSGYKNTIINTTIGTLYNLALTIPSAYVLSKRKLPLRGVLNWYFFLTMYISGGMVPTYLVIKSLGLLNTRWALVLGAGVSCWNLIVTRQYFTTSIPETIYEAAHIDGASELHAFIRIALPLARPILAVMALFYGVGHWNSYYSALLYVQKKALWPLQLVLRNILISNEATLGMVDTMDSEAVLSAARRAYVAFAMKYALILIASGPLLIAYPFVQKYFVQGMLIGSVKG